MSSTTNQISYALFILKYHTIDDRISFIRITIDPFNARHSELCDFVLCQRKWNERTEWNGSVRVNCRCKLRISCASPLPPYLTNGRSHVENSTTTVHTLRFCEAFSQAAKRFLSTSSVCAFESCWVFEETKRNQKPKQNKWHLKSEWHT